MGKSSINEPFPMAMLNNQRVTEKRPLMDWEWPGISRCAILTVFF